MKSKFLTLLVLAPLVLGACGDDDGSGVRNVGESSEGGSASGSESGTGSGSAMACVPVGDPASADQTIAVALDEWSVTPDPGSSRAGSINFAADNVGEDGHELVIVEGDDPEALPLDDEGAVDEAALAEGSFIGEIEVFPPGETCDGVFELAAGDYVLFCNIVEVEDGEVENHFELGMRTVFTAE